MTRHTAPLPGGLPRDPSGYTTLLTVPEGIEGAEACLDFDRTARQFGHNQYIREIIPGEFDDMPEAAEALAEGRRLARQHGAGLRVLVSWQPAHGGHVRIRALANSVAMPDGMKA